MNANTLTKIGRTCDEYFKVWFDASNKTNQYCRDNSINPLIITTTDDSRRKEIIGNKQKEYDEYIRLYNDADLKYNNYQKHLADFKSVNTENNRLNRKGNKLRNKINKLK